MGETHVCWFLQHRNNKEVGHMCNICVCVASCCGRLAVRTSQQVGERQETTTWSLSSPVSGA
jgi:hypothetical protein